MSSKIQVKRLCQHCKSEFTARTTVTKYCSHDCSRKAYKDRLRRQKLDASDKETAYRQVTNKKEAYDKPILTVKEAAEVLGVSSKMIHQLIREGKLLASNLCCRLTRVVKSSVVELLEYTRIEAKIHPASHPPKINGANPIPLTKEACYTIPELTALFGMDRQCLYTLLSRKNVPKIKNQKSVFFAKAEVHKLLKEREQPMVTRLETIRKANQKEQESLRIEDCYTIPELEVMFGKERALLYSFFKRRAVPTLKVGTQVYLSKKAIRKVYKALKAA